MITRASYQRLLRRVADEVDTIQITLELVARLGDDATRRLAQLRLRGMIDQAAGKVRDLGRHPGRKL
jgi:hypothetical protein